MSAKYGSTLWWECMDRPLNLPALPDCYGQYYDSVIIPHLFERKVLGKCLFDQDAFKDGDRRYFECGYGLRVANWDANGNWATIRCDPPYCEFKQRDAYGNLITEDDGTRIDDPAFDDCAIYLVSYNYSDPID